MSEASPVVDTLSANNKQHWTYTTSANDNVAQGGATLCAFPQVWIVSGRPSKIETDAKPRRANQLAVAYSQHDLLA